jgi:hypothetical protein
VEKPLSKKGYKKRFGLDKPDSKKKRKIRKSAFLKAWEIRNFEIELYWKRATYFWAFMITIVGAYGVTFADEPQNIEQISYFRYLMMCTGLIVAFAWQLTNKGSKSWMRSWEKHIDMLENEFTGPLYKTVGSAETFSVSKINEIISTWFIFIWLALIVQYLSEKSLLTLVNFNIDVSIFVPSLFTVLFISSMIYGYGRGRFGFKSFKMYARKVDV